MKITILTLFPEMFKGPFEQSIIKNAIDKKLVEITYVNIRDSGIGKHKIIDDTEYGGGIGMVMKVDVLHNAIESVRTGENNEEVVLLSATGETYNQKIAKSFSKLNHLILICGHYEGVDERIKKYINMEVSIGDFVLTGGEIPVMLITDSVSRLITGVLPKGATEDESFSEINNKILLEYPHYTKPRIFKNKHVPDILLSGNHPEIKKWREKKAIEVTNSLRPDLLKKRNG
ncbi:MAG TPA: tRNA (guanosine(37)-N1)-methyltransferase TrmD [Candidatus Limnocylindrales bacterium]|nr:tRNA (guanosine(37)-N1)-methyltransferase TrmD [Candidatus Limnocylindrales bacterium]